MNILVASINRILYVFFKKQVAAALDQIIIAIIYHIYIGFFGYKSHYNKNAYNIQNTRRILDIFDAEDDRYFDNESYGLIFHSGFVYVLYLSEKKLRGAKLFQ